MLSHVPGPGWHKVAEAGKDKVAKDINFKYKRHWEGSGLAIERKHALLGFTISKKNVDIGIESPEVGRDDHFKPNELF